MDVTTAEMQRQREALAGLALPAFAPPDPARPPVIAVEGPNGVGKTTLCRALTLRFGLPYLQGVDSAFIAEPFRVRMIRDAAWYASALFFFSGCCEQMRLLHGRPEPVALLDRSFWSTLAVHAAADPARLAVLLAMLRPIAPQFALPDLTLVLTATYATCRHRIAAKTGVARALDDLTADAAFHAREQEFYRWLAAHRSGVLFLDADSASAPEVAAAAVRLLRENLPCFPS